MQHYPPFSLSAQGPAVKWNLPQESFDENRALRAPGSPLAGTPPTTVILHHRRRRRAHGCLHCASNN